MPRSFELYQKKHFSPSFYQLCQAFVEILPETLVLEFRGNRQLKQHVRNGSLSEEPNRFSNAEAGNKSTDIICAMDPVLSKMLQMVSPLPDF